MSRTLMILFLLICPMTLITYCQTTDSETFDKVLKQLDLNKSDCHPDLLVSEIMPYAHEKSVLVIPVIMEKTEDSYKCDSYILIINNETGEILNKFYESNALISDAISITQISIDFAPYKLNSKIRAFGIRVKYEGHSSPNPYENEELSLFVPKDSVLIRILKNFSISSDGGEWDTNCEGQFTSEKKTLIMSDKAVNNFCDIIVKTKIISTKKTKVNGDCIDKETSLNNTSILHYNNVEYK